MILAGGVTGSVYLEDANDVADWLAMPSRLTEHGAVIPPTRGPGEDWIEDETPEASDGMDSFRAFLNQRLG